MHRHLHQGQPAVLRRRGRCRHRGGHLRRHRPRLGVAGRGRARGQPSSARSDKVNNIAADRGVPPAARRARRHERQAVPADGVHAGRPGEDRRRAGSWHGSRSRSTSSTSRATTSTARAATTRGSRTGPVTRATSTPTWTTRTRSTSASRAAMQTVPRRRSQSTQAHDRARVLRPRLAERRRRRQERRMADRRWSRTWPVRRGDGHARVRQPDRERPELHVHHDTQAVATYCYTGQRRPVVVVRRRLVDPAEDRLAQVSKGLLGAMVWEMSGDTQRHPDERRRHRPSVKDEGRFRPPEVNESALRTFSTRTRRGPGVR